MAAVIPNPSKVNQRAVIQFLSFEGCQAVDIHRRMKAAYGDKCLSRTRVMEWARMFRKGRELTKDLPRPGQAQVVATKETIDKIDSALRENRGRTLRSLAEEFDISVGTVQTVVRKKLKYQWVCSQWVPPMLTDRDKCVTMEIGEAAVRDYYDQELGSSKNPTSCGTTTYGIQGSKNTKKLTTRVTTEAQSHIHEVIKNRAKICLSTAHKEET